jgi:hypothetical protein
MQRQPDDAFVPASAAAFPATDASPPDPRGKLAQATRDIVAPVIDQRFAVDLAHDQPLGFRFRQGQVSHGALACPLAQRQAREAETERSPACRGSAYPAPTANMREFRQRARRARSRRVPDRGDRPDGEKVRQPPHISLVASPCRSGKVAITRALPSHH